MAPPRLGISTSGRAGPEDSTVVVAAEPPGMRVCLREQPGTLICLSARAGVTGARGGERHMAIHDRAVRTEAPAAAAGPREEGGGNVLARTGARAATRAKAGVSFPLANAALLGRRCGQAQRSILLRIVAVMARPAANTRGRLREIPL